MPRAEMLSRMSSRELTEWMAFFRLEQEDREKNKQGGGNAGQQNAKKSRAEIEAGM